MTSRGGRDDTFDTYDTSSFGPSEAREPGARRRKIAGYLRAANELRQAYQQSYKESLGGSGDRSIDGDDRIPGAFPTERHTLDDQLIIFPSYAIRRHKDKSPTNSQNSQYPVRRLGVDASANESDDPAAWDRRENERAIVDVDVRGWLYTPQTGPLNRKNRVWISLARQLVGIPALAGKTPPGSTSASRSTSPHGLRQRMEAKAAKQEEELVAKEAATLLKRGQEEAAAAGEGAYSERPAREGEDNTSTYDDKARRKLGKVHGLNNGSAPEGDIDGEDDPIQQITRRSSWIEPSQMSQQELEIANGFLLKRLKPFMANPLPSHPVSAFFYNETSSHQQSIETNPDGHFNIRAALDFIPTHVRVLASDSLSLTEEVHLTEPLGVSLISDIDDTVKYSAIGSGPREIFRNVFIRDLGDLKIQGVAEWYAKLAKLDVKFHYVSNSPWQLYPCLTEYFTEARLPPGSFHLKQYSGMLQGIFEPVAERKKGPLEKILKDFPHRKFLLIGDSGEADLEVYTDIVLEHPGRIVGIFIRDVTTTADELDSELGPLRRDEWDRIQKTNWSGTIPTSEAGSGRYQQQQRQNHDDDNDPAMKAAIRASLAEYEKVNGIGHSGSAPEEKRPPLPPRRQTEPVVAAAEEEENLIDLDWEEDGNPKSATDVPSQRPTAPNNKKANAPRPTIPRKPVGLSAPATNSAGKPAPPRPAKPTSFGSSSDFKTESNGTDLTPSRSEPTPESLGNLQQQQDPKPAKPPPPPQRKSVNGMRAEGVQVGAKKLGEGEQKQEQEQEQPPPLPLRTRAAQLSATAAQYAADLYSAAPSLRTASSDTDLVNGAGAGASTSPASAWSPTGTARKRSSQYSQHSQPAVLSKKEEMWKRRWSKAKLVLDEKRVVLRAWRNGEDVMHDAVELVHKHGLK